MTIKNLKLLILNCNFTFYILHFTFLNNAYALNLDKFKVYFLNGDYKSAILEGEKMLANYSQSFGLDELYYILGLSYLKDGNYLRASDIFEIILKEFKDSNFKEEAKLGLADSYFLKGDFAKTQDYYQELISSNPHTQLKAAVYYRLSQLRFKTGDIQTGKEYLNKLKEKFPLNLETRLDKDISFISGNLSDVYYTVQVGSFLNKINAQNLIQRLIQKDYPAYLEEVSLPDKTIYRVRVGKFRLHQEAVAQEFKLSQDGYPTKLCP